MSHRERLGRQDNSKGETVDTIAYDAPLAVPEGATLTEFPALSSPAWSLVATEC